MRNDYYIQASIIYVGIQCIFRMILILFRMISRVLQHHKEIFHPQTVRKSRFSQGLAGVEEVLPAVEHRAGHPEGQVAGVEA